MVNGRTYGFRLPCHCLLCDAPAGALALCDGCLADLPWNRRCCRYCALPVPPGQDRCGDCSRARPLQAATLAPLRYEFPVDHLVAGLKYRGRLAHAPLLGELLKEAVLEREGPLPDLVLPVPLHAGRLGVRGYNQALEIARPVARATATPLETSLLRRLRATTAQMTLDAKARARNPEAAFGIDRKRLATLGCPGRVALVDDVMTTGATLAAASQALLEAGVAEVEYWVVARTP